MGLLRYLTERGATIEQMVDAHRAGALPGVAGELVTQGRTGWSLWPRSRSAAASLSQHVMRILLAAGIPAERETEIPADLERLMSAFEQGSALMGEEAILAFTRVLGAAANNVAEAAIALFFAELGPGTVRGGPDELGRARLAEAATTVFTEVPDVLAHLVMDAFERAQRRAQTARPWLGPVPSAEDEAEGPTEVVALGFVDLVGSTAWALTLPLRDQNLALTRFESAAWTSAVLAGGRVIKMIGDEVFFAAPTAEAACRIGLEVCRAAAEDDVLPPARGAVGIGPATPREGDYFGPLVNLLARLVKAGAPGEVVVTEAVAEELSPDEWVGAPARTGCPAGHRRLRCGRSSSMDPARRTESKSGAEGPHGTLPDRCINSLVSLTPCVAAVNTHDEQGCSGRPERARSTLAIPRSMGPIPMSVAPLGASSHLHGQGPGPSQWRGPPDPDGGGRRRIRDSIPVSPSPGFRLRTSEDGRTRSTLQRPEVGRRRAGLDPSTMVPEPSSEAMPHPGPTTCLPPFCAAAVNTPDYC